MCGRAHSPSSLLDITSIASCPSRKEAFILPTLRVTGSHEECFLEYRLGHTTGNDALLQWGDELIIW